MKYLRNQIFQNQTQMKPAKVKFLNHNFLFFWQILFQFSHFVILWLTNLLCVEMMWRSFGRWRNGSDNDTMERFTSDGRDYQKRKEKKTIDSSDIHNDAGCRSRRTNQHHHPSCSRCISLTFFFLFSFLFFFSLFSPLLSLLWNFFCLISETDKWNCVL